MTAEKINQVWENIGPVQTIGEGSIYEAYHDAVAQALTDYFEVPVYSHGSFEQPVEVTNDMTAPCIILIGPDPRECQSPIFAQTFDVGTDQGGRVVTETHHHIECYDFYYSAQYDAQNHYDLLRAMEQWTNFFKDIYWQKDASSKKQKGYLSIFGRPFKVCKEEQLSPLNIRNYTDVSSGRGSFEVKQLPISNSEYVEQSKRVSSTQKTITKRS